MKDKNASRIFAMFSRNTTIKLQPPQESARQESRLEDYLRKSAVLRQIMSNKSGYYRRVNAGQNIATVVVSSFLLFFGFSGQEKVQKWASWFVPASADGTELAYNFLVFILFVLGILHLVFHFSDKQAKADQAVAALAALANEIEDTITSRGNLVISEDINRIAIIRSRYEAIAQGIPSNTDREFIRAKRDLARKESKKPRVHISPKMLFDEGEHERIVSTIILGSITIVDVLITLRKTDKSLYLGGGLIRNAVWDYLHGYKWQTPVEDVDVIYFKQHDVEKRHDEAFNEKLAREIPNLRWSAKNQARMHGVNGEQPYINLTDAVSRWPETATAIIVRLRDDASLEFIAPHGYDDLLRLIVRSTPAFVGRENAMLERARIKRWQETWPRLQIWTSGSAGELGRAQVNSANSAENGTAS